VLLYRKFFYAPRSIYSPEALARVSRFEERETEIEGERVKERLQIDERERETQPTVAGKAAHSCRNLSNDNGVAHRCHHRARRVPIYKISLPHSRPKPGSGPTRLRRSGSAICGSRRSELRFAEQPPFLEPGDSDLLFPTDPTTNRRRIRPHAPHSPPAPQGIYAPRSMQEASLLAQLLSLLL
jgi:hypothetical protein